MKYAVISTSNSSEYYSLIPLVAYSWHKLGYTPIVIMVNCPLELQGMLKKHCPEGTVFRSLPALSGVKDGTVAQFSRLFAASEVGEPDDIIVTGDGDMIMMKDIFHNTGTVESYGKDLTGYSQNPICYISSSVKNWDWLMVINETGLEANIRAELPLAAYSEDWEIYWTVDQVLLTSRIKERGAIEYERGMEKGLAKGRWDRYRWDDIPSDIIDVHCIRGLNRWDEITAMAEYLFPNEVGWMAEFYNEIKAIGV